MNSARRLVRSAKWRVSGAVRPVFDRAGNALLQPPRHLFGSVALHGSRATRQVALTFDDGPSRPCTESMLDALADCDVKATFFCVGEMVEWYPDIVARADAEGHVIGNHSMYHSRRQSASLRNDMHIARTQEIIASAIGKHPALYRPPWGWLTPQESRRVNRAGLTVIGWDVYPDDWKVPETPAAVTAEQVCSRAQPGSIILMHDATSNIRDCAKTESAAAVRLMVQRLRDDGYTFVNVHELLGLSPYLADTTSVAVAASGSAAI
jgi:peptidoglycan-N-acetylglucosamine deacetylase